VEVRRNMGKSDISYLEGGKVWNVLTGCSGKGCQAHCYARDMVRRFPAIHGAEKGVDGSVVDGTAGGWIEKIPFNEVVFHPSRLSEPLHWRKPRVVGVGFFGDLFDEQVKDSWLYQIYPAMVKASQHTYIILTKQPKRMAQWLSATKRAWQGQTDHTYHGLTVCTQAEADEKIPELLKLPGKKWISIEPMLGPVSIKWALRPQLHPNLPCVNFVVVGGESGPKARPMHPDWVRSIRNQCAAAGVPFFFKCWGEWGHGSQYDLLKNVKRWEWAGEGASAAIMARVGTKAAGRTLDGRIHDELPWRKS
jgi:protein gp37